VRLELIRQLDAEAIYYYDSATGDCVYSSANRFTVRLRSKEEHTFILPVTGGVWRRWCLRSRICRRLLRLDMASAVLNNDRSGLIVLYQSRIYFYDLQARRVLQTGKLRQCRNVLAGSIAVTAHGVYFGEYGQNPARERVPVWRSLDAGRSWHIGYEFPAGSIRHIHGVYADPYTDRLWLTTGDFKGECYLVETDPTLCSMKFHGDGSQQWRTVQLLFEKDKIFWVMDSQLETSYLQMFDRTSGSLERLRDFPGPVWYVKRLDDGWSLIQTTREVGPGVRTDSSHLLISRNLIDWHEVARFRKDWWPMPYFKFGVITFADGPQTSADFCFFCQALDGLDGQSFVAAIRD
jgi:hypothetical protein